MLQKGKDSMAKKLVIVESPHKSKTIDKLASEFEQCQKIYSRLFQSKDRRI